MPGVNPYIWMDAWGEHLDLDGCLGVNSLFWMDARSEFFDLDALRFVFQY